MPTLALLSWIVLAPLIATQLTASQIVIWLTLVPYLFLPEAFSLRLPGLPDIDKTAVISLGLLLAYLVHKDKFVVAGRAADPQLTARLLGILLFSLFALMLAGSALTLLSNQYPLFYGPKVVRPMRPWDFVSLVAGLIFMVTPFFFAWRYLPFPELQKNLLKALAIMGLIYSFFMLVEIRLSPQLHKWVYGYFQHSFAQHIRDGFRPIMFLEHGIWVGFFMFSAVISAFKIWVSTKETKWLLSGLWLLAVLCVSKNMGAVVIFVVCFGMMQIHARLQLKIAAAIALIVLLYPALRQSQVIPTAQIVGWAEAVSEDRAESLQFRLDTEDALLTRASLKPWTGWGWHGREQIFDDDGNRSTVPDGLWILTIGRYGWVGYVALFGILTAPVIFLWLGRRGQAPPPPETMGLVLIITGNLIYMIPNATLTPVGWLTFGALAGYVRYGAVSSQDAGAEQAEPEGPAPRRVAYSRFTPGQRPNTSTR